MGDMETTMQKKTVFVWVHYPQGLTVRVQTLPASELAAFKSRTWREWGHAVDVIDEEEYVRRGGK